MVTRQEIKAILGAVADTSPVNGLTHNFYRYPARFSPKFARKMIEIFTAPGDVVLDPFMGGATTLVEARALGRRPVGVDISELAAFLARVKTSFISISDAVLLYEWCASLNERAKLTLTSDRPLDWIEEGYQRNINCRSTWPIRKTLELAIGTIHDLPKPRHRRFARCILLKTGQWALDCRAEFPTAEDYRFRILESGHSMLKGALEFASAARDGNRLYPPNPKFRQLILNRSVIGIETESHIQEEPPRLILTSPPYPGVHVLYHRWQVQGRRETPAPFWIANCNDGSGAAYYTLGDRKQKGQRNYFKQILKSFKSLRSVSGKDTVVVQLVSFADPDRQLQKYLSVLEEAGFQEIQSIQVQSSPDGRIRRSVPGRKWYAEQIDDLPSSREVVLFHKPA